MSFLWMPFSILSRFFFFICVADVFFQAHCLPFHCRWYSHCQQSLTFNIDMAHNPYINRPTLNRSNKQEEILLIQRKKMLEDRTKNKWMRNFLQCRVDNNVILRSHKFRNMLLKTNSIQQVNLR